MTDVKRLLAEATPLPWRLFNEYGVGSGSIVAGIGGRDYVGKIAMTGAEQRANAALIVHAVNSLPAYEEAVEALTEILDTEHPEADGPCYLCKDARAALARLRGDA